MTTFTGTDITCGRCTKDAGETIKHYTVARVRECYASPVSFIVADQAEDNYGLMIAERGGIPYGAFCDTYEVHEAHVYVAINGMEYSCPGFTSEDLDVLLSEANAEPCEHGLSASLCAGPDHYPADDRSDW